MKRPPILRLYEDELVVDLFAGGGGTSVGIERALGRSPDIAINHDREAIAMHRANHPDTKHYIENVRRVDPRKACGNPRIGLMWLSRDCFPAGTLTNPHKNQLSTHRGDRRRRRSPHASRPLEKGHRD